MIRLVSVQAKDHDLLYSINQKYLYEMTNYYDDEMDEHGNYGYGHFEEYFTDPKRKAYFICNDEKMVGFAFLCPYSNLTEYLSEHSGLAQEVRKDPDYTMAEFTIFPAFRRKHYALDAANLILDQHRGKWEIKYNEKNAKAKNLWTAVTMPYHPEVYHLNEEETVFVFSNIEG